MLRLSSVLILLLLLLLQARELSELLDFAEQERLTLLEREAALQQELGQVRQLAAAPSGSTHGCSQQHAAMTRTDAAVSGKLMTNALAGSQLAAFVAEERFRAEVGASAGASAACQLQLAVLQRRDLMLTDM
jgi:hypothetical protein